LAPTKFILSFLIFTVGHTTEFFAFECPPLFPGGQPIVVFQSLLNPSNFLGVRSSQGELELVSDVREKNKL